MSRLEIAARSVRLVAFAMLIGASVLTPALMSACGSSGGDEPTSPDTSDTNPPSTPGALTATTDGPFGVALAWQAATDDVGVVGYQLERCEGSGCSTFASAASVSATSFNDTGLTAATEYRYRVRAVDSGGNFGGYSSVAAATTSATTPPPTSNLPAWISALAVGQWTQIPGTAMSSVEPSPVPAGSTGPESKVIAWTSFVVDTRNSKVYSLANGGHNDYAGNEVDVLDLEASPPAWTRVLGPTSAAQVSSNCQSYYSDGRPSARHTYYGVTFSELNDRFMLFGGVPWCFNGGFHAAVSSFNIASRTWSPSGSHPNMPNSLTQGVAAVTAIPATGDVYVVRDFTIGKWTRGSNRIVMLSPTGAVPFGDSTMSAYDSARGRILYAGGLERDRHLYDVANNSFTTVTLSGTITLQDEAAMVYVPALDRFLVRLAGSGGTVYMIHPSTFAVSTFATTGGGGIPSTRNGPYNKFLYVPRLGGIVYVPAYDSNAWFLRVH